MSKQSSQILRRMVVVASVLAGVMALVSAAQSAKPAVTAPAKSTGPATNAAPAAPPEPPKAVFYVKTSMQDSVKDPFFPLSKRFERVVPVVIPTNSATPVVMVRLELKGISGSATQRLAIINSHTFAQGEEAELGSGNERSRVKVIEIKDDSVIVEVRGERQVLHLRSGL